VISWIAGTSFLCLLTVLLWLNASTFVLAIAVAAGAVVGAFAFDPRSRWWGPETRAFVQDREQVRHELRRAAVGLVVLISVLAVVSFVLASTGTLGPR
jgi:hypothetical protein